MRLKNLDLIMTLIIVMLNVIWALLPSHLPVIGTILSLPLVFILPGYTLTEVLFRKQFLETSHRFVLSIGLSLAIDILGGLILNLLPVGLEGISWAVFLGSLTTIFSLLACYLRRGTWMNVVRLPRLRLSIYEATLFGLAAIVIGLSIVYDAIGLAQAPRPGFTQLWMLPAAQPGKSCAVHLGVRSFESTSVTYSITMTINRGHITPWSSITLNPEQEWDRLMPISPGATDNVYVEAQLYRLDKPEAVYRQVHVTLNNCTVSSTSSLPYPSVAGAYQGTIHDISANLTTNMSLKRIQQSARNITGYFNTGRGWLKSGPFKGTIISTQDIQFTVTNDAGSAILYFEGGLQLGGVMSGSYCGLDQKGQCSSNSNYGYGLWSVAPT